MVDRYFRVNQNQLPPDVNRFLQKRNISQILLQCQDKRRLYQIFYLEKNWHPPQYTDDVLIPKVNYSVDASSMSFCANVTLPQILQGGTVFTLASVGFLTYLVVILATLTSKELMDNTYYYLTLSLGFSDCIGLVVFIVYCSSMITCGKGNDPWGGEMVNGKWGGVLNIGWFSGIPTILTLGFNRYIRLNHGDALYYKIFDKRATLIWIAVGWLIGLGIAIPTFWHGCFILFHPEFFAWVWETTEKCADAYAMFEFVLVVVVCAIAFVLYTLIMVRMRIHHNSIQRADMAVDSIRDAIQRKHHSQEVRLGIQCFVVTLWFLGYDTAFIVISYVPVSDEVSFLITLAYIVNNSINAYVYLALNSKLRQAVKKMLCGVQKGIGSTTWGSHPPPTRHDHMLTPQHSAAPIHAHVHRK